MTAASPRTSVSVSAAALLALFALAGGYCTSTLRVERTRPWHLETRLESLLAECRTGDGSRALRADYARVERRAEEAKALLRATDSVRWIRRNYAQCELELLAACLDAQMFKLRLAQRRREQGARLSALAGSLRHELDPGGRSRKIWSRFEFRDLDRTRARSLLAQAERLASEGQAESAVEQALRAWGAWQRFNDQSDFEFARFDDAALREDWDRRAMELLSWTRETGRRAILVDKLEHRCLVLKSGEIEKSYSADLGRNWYRQKVREQDASTPEGEYRVRRLIPAGTYGRALLLDYPNSADRERFKVLKEESKIPQGARIGGSVEIHGGGRNADWTDGCVSLAAEDMLDLYRRSYAGMPVTIVGTCRLTASLQGK